MAGQSFATEVKSFLEAHAQVGAVSNGFSSPFSAFSVPSHHLIFHCVDVQPDLLFNLPHDFFQHLSHTTFHSGWQVVHLWQDLWVTNKDIIRSRIRSILGFSRKVHARSTHVCRLDKKQANAFLSASHSMVNTSAYYKYGLMLKDTPVAVATFSKARTIRVKDIPLRSVEWVRYASVRDITVVGGMSRLLQHCIRELNPHHVMTYADLDWGMGKTYEKLGFRFTGFVKPGSFYIRLPDMQRFYSSRLPPDVVNHALNASASELLSKCGLVNIHNAGSVKFEYDVR